jgi:hypothetical protein
MTDQMDPNQRNQPFADEQETATRTDGRDDDELQGQALRGGDSDGGQVPVTQGSGGAGGQATTGLPGQILTSAFTGPAHDQPVEGRRDQPEDPADQSEDIQSGAGREADADSATLGH